MKLLILFGITTFSFLFFANVYETIDPNIEPPTLRLQPLSNTNPLPGVYSSLESKIEPVNISCFPLRLKNWHYMNFVSTDGSSFLALAIIDMQLFQQAWVIYKSNSEPCKQIKMEKPFFLSLDPKFDISLSGATWGNKIKLSNQSVVFDLPEIDLQGAITFSKSESDLILTYPFRQDRLTFTIKPGIQDIVYSTLPFFQNGGYVMGDYTKGCEMRETRWKWAAVSGKTLSGKRFLLNLSSTERFQYYENVLWLDKKRIYIDSVQFTSFNTTDGLWRKVIGKDIDLTFTPIGNGIQENFNFLLVATNFHQAWGLYSGTIMGENINQVLGCGETHYAFW